MNLKIAIAFLAAVLVAFVIGVRDAAERALFTGSLHALTGADAGAENVAIGPGGIVAVNLRLSNLASGATLEAARATISVDAGTLLTGRRGRHDAFDISLSGAHLAFSGDHVRDALGQIAASVARLDLRDYGVRLAISDGTLEVKRTDAATPSLVVTPIAGSLRWSGARVSYDVRSEIVDGAKRYPIAGNASDDGTTIAHSWLASGLPLAPVLNAFAPSELVAHGGMLRNLAFSAVERAGSPLKLRGNALLEDGAFALGAPAHAFSKLHGAFVAEDGAIASPGIAGTLDGVPLQLCGELGTLKDAQQFERLLLGVAAEPNLQEARVEAVARGVAFAKYRLQSPDGRLAIHVASVDASDPTISFNTVLAGDHITSGGERTSTMGQRTGAVLGLDGDYFDIGQSYAPQGIVVRSGTLLRSPAKRMALTVHRGNRLTFDEYRFEGTLKTATREIPIASVNDFPPAKVTIVTPEFGTLHPKDGVTFVALSPLPAGQHKYRVTSVGPITANRPAELGLAFGRWAGHKPPRVGETVELDYGTIPAYDDVVTAIGGGPLMIKDGAWIEDPDAPAPEEHDVRWPVVGVGRLADDSVLFFEVDGRWPDISIGMKRPEFGDLMLRYHVVDGFAFDSGGSATIVARAPGDHEVSVRSHPSDQSYERYVTDAFFVYSSAPAPSILLKPEALSQLPVR